jgi:hypothetical protein
MPSEQSSTSDLDHFISEHLKDAQAVLVVDGSANEVIAQLLATGWIWADRPTVHCTGKRVRYLQAPLSEDETGGQ